jgi:sulfite exporter TauE/SafE
MLASINPLGERSRKRTWWVTASWYVAGSVVGGAVMGLGAGAIGRALDALLAPTEATVAVVAGLLGLSALAFEVQLGGLVLPTVRRQVDENWIHRYRAWVYAGGFGVQLGLGVVTVVTTATVYLTWAFAVLTGSLIGGLVVGVTFGLARAMPILLVSHVESPGELRDVLRRFAGWAPAARRVSSMTTAAVGIVSLLAVIIVTGSGS